MSRICLIFSILTCLYVTVVSSAVAQAVDPVSVDRLALTVDAVKDHSITATTFYITPNVGLDSVSFFASDLQDTTRTSTTQPVIISSQVSFAPATLQSPLVGRRQQVQVSLNDITRAGVWAGQVTIQWTGTVTGELNLPITVTVKTIPVLSLESPSTMVVRGVRGQPVDRRRATVHETGGDSPATKLSIFPQSLYTDDRSREISSTAIQARLATSDDSTALTEIAGDGRANVIVALNLSDAHSGSYLGNLILQSDNAADLLIPLKVDVKDPWPLPLFFLAIGVLAGVILTWYRSTVMPKDQVRVRIQDLRDHMRDDQQFADFCGDQKVKPAIQAADEELRRDRMVEAGTALAPAESVWNSWIQYRQVLVESIEALGALLTTIDGSGDDFLYVPCVAALRDELYTTRTRQIPEYVDKPLELRGKILAPAAGWQAVLSRALSLHQSLAEIQRSLDQPNTDAGLTLDADDLASLHAQLDQLTTQFKAIVGSPTAATLSTLYDAIGPLNASVATASEAGKTAKSDFGRYRGEAESWLSQFDLDPNSPITQVVEFVRTAGLGPAQQQADLKRWKAATQLAENSWRAARVAHFLDESAQRYRQGRTDAPWNAVVEAESELASWLTNGDHYTQSTREFFAALAKLASTLKSSVDRAVGPAGQRFPLDWSTPPQAGGRGTSFGVSDQASAPSLVQREVQVPYIQPTEQMLPASWRFWRGTWWTPRRRLLVAHLATFVIGVGLLAFVGFKELYADVSTFGVDGAWDYFKLFAWGFGAEAGRAQVVGLVRDWGVLTPRTAQ